MKRWMKILLPILLVLFIGVCIFYESYTNPTYKTMICFGTNVGMTLYGPKGKDTAERIEQSLYELDYQKLSVGSDESDIATINAAMKETREVRLEDDTQRYLHESLALCLASDGALDITVDPLITLWGIEGDSPKVPAPEQISDCLTHVGYDKIRLNDEKCLTCSDSQTGLNLGAVGKGIACDEVCRILEESEVKGATVAVGGSILVYGSKPHKEAFEIGIQKPDAPTGETMGYVTVSAPAVISTSGDYEKYFTEGGKRYHHILDPKTGYPAESGLSSVTVVCENGLASDGLSTACYIMGVEDSLALLKQYDAEAIFCRKDGSVYVTEGLQDSVHITDESYRLDIK